MGQRMLIQEDQSPTGRAASWHRQPQQDLPPQPALRRGASRPLEFTPPWVNVEDEALRTTFLEIGEDWLVLSRKVFYRGSWIS